MAERVGQSFGNYQVLRLLGQGSFAEVYLAEHRYLEIPAAIKILHVRMEPDTHEQFRREARTIAHLQHPHIVQVLDFGLDDQTPYLVMEYTPGGTLRSHHPKGTQLPFEQIVIYVKQIASALDYAHQRHIIHRDVKPENLLLNARHQVVLSDFGLATIAHSTGSLSTSAQRTGGTIAYMAPEQIEGHPRTASDQYALGVMVYEWLCGQCPFEGSLREVMVQHLSMPPPPLHERVPTISPTVEQVVLRALAKDPHQRFSSVQDFATMLEEACVASEPLVSHAPLEREVWAQLAPSVAPAAMASEVDCSAELPQSRLQPAQRTGDEREPLQGLGARPVVQSPTVSKQTRPSGAQSNRQRFLRKVRAFWITGVFEHSLHGAALLALGLQEQPDAVANPWQLVLQHSTGAPRSLPAGIRITEVYDRAEGELLILGAPGSGKSTLLLELARELLSRAEHDERHPLPAVFNLSSWASQQQPLADWLVEELSSTYQVPRKLGRAWVEADQILPLLDGLDEVAPQDRTTCIEAINTYRQEHGLLPLVVCSRSVDYLAQDARVRLGSAVAVQPLTEQQVNDHLAQVGEPLWALQVALQQDATLRELTSTPLMLSILTLTYHDMALEGLLREGIAPTRQHVFERYVERMLKHRGAVKRYTAEQTTHWLTFLARQLKQHNQTVFYLEHLQPDWLTGAGMHRIYDRWALRFPAILMGMLVTLAINLLLGYYVPSLTDLARYLAPIMVLGGFMGWLLGRGSTSQPSHENSRKARRVSWARLVARLRVGLLFGLSFGLVVGLNSGLILGLNAGLSLGLSAGLIFGLSGILLQVALEKSTRAASSFLVPPLSRKLWWKNLLKQVGIRNGILIGLIFGLSLGLVVGLNSGLNFGLNAWLINGLNFGLINGLSGGLLSMLLIGKPVGITLTDELVWSWRSLGRSLFAKRHLSTTLRVMVFIGLIIGWIFGLIAGLSNGLAYALSVGLASGLSFWLLFGLFQGVSSETIGDQYRVVPNQGIRHSARNSLILGLISTAIVGLGVALGFGLSLGLIEWLSVGLNAELALGLNAGLSLGLIIGLSVGLLTGLLYGGLACLRHSVVRLILWRAGSIPWNYPGFLDAATEHILLRKVGGGYIFIHRLLLEYFASLDTTPPRDEAVVQKQHVLPIS